MGAPLVYGLYLIAGTAGRATAKYAVKKIGERVVGKLVSRHKTIDAAKNAFTRLRNAIEKKLTPKVPQHKIQYSTKGEIGKTPAVSQAGHKGLIPLSQFQKGVQNDLLNARAGGVATGRLNTIIKGVIPAVTAGTLATGSVYKLTQAQNKKLKDELQQEIRRANAPTKSEYMKVVKAQSPSESKAAEKSYEDFMSGKARSLKFNYGGMVKKKKRKK